MNELREWQKHIFGAAKSAGITDSGDLHELVYNVCGKESLKEITKHDYLIVIKELEMRSSGRQKSRKTSSPAKTRAVGGMSQGQIALVWRLMYELRNYDREPSTVSLGERLCGIIKRELKIDAQPKEPFVWLSYKDGSVLIERIKNYVYSAAKRHLRGD